MIKTLQFLLIVSISALTVDCKADSFDYFTENTKQNIADTLIVDFEYGENFSSTAWKNIYVIWLEDTTSDFIQNILICKKLISGGLTGTALPYWKLNKYPISSSNEVDAVTAATQANSDFSVSAFLKDSLIRKFVLYFEVDRSFEPNDWFSDQPALLYSVNVDLDDTVSEYELLPIGWTPNENTQNKIPNTPKGELQKEMKYITNHKTGSTFGLVDERSSTRMVKKITAQVKSKKTTNISSVAIDDSNFSVFPNPSDGHIIVKSREPIIEIIITNIQGQIILQTQPGTIETVIVLNKDIAPVGSYFFKIRSANKLSTHKILITD